MELILGLGLLLVFPLALINYWYRRRAFLKLCDDFYKACGFRYMYDPKATWEDIKKNREVN